MMVFLGIGLSETTFAAPKIDENGRLVLPSAVHSPLPTNIEQFFKKNDAYEYGAALSIQEGDNVDKTKGYTLSKHRAYNEIESVLGHTPEWGGWAKQIQEQMNKNSSIEIAGQLSKGGVQVKGDYLGYAAFYVIGNDSDDDDKKSAFMAVLPKIRARNQFINQMENMGNLSPKERAKLVHAYDYFHAQAQPNEYRAPYVFNPDYRKSAIDGEYWGREAKHTVCSRYAYYVSGSHKICRSSPMSFMELAQRGLNRKSNDLANHFDEVWQETNSKARQDLNQMGAAQAPDNLNYVGKASYRANGVFSAAATVPDFAIRVTGADKAAAHLYDAYAPNKAKAFVAYAGQEYTDWARNNPNIAETSKFGLNVAKSVAGIKAGLPKKAGRGHDDFADYVKSNIDESRKARESSNFKNYANSDNVLRIEHDSKLTTTVDGNLSVTHGLGYDAKKELDGIRAFLVENKKSVLNAKSKSPNNLTIATAEVIENNGSITNYLAVSGKADAISSKINKDNFGREFVDISIDGNQTRYFIIRQSPSGVNQPYNYATPKSENNKFDNVNHAEEKLMGFLTQNQNISSVKLKVQNTDDEVQGLCKGCGGKYSESSYENKQNGSTLEDFSRKNTFKIHVEHGSTSQK